METDDNFDRNKILNLFAFFIESLSLYTQSLVKQISHIIRTFIENFQIAELFDAISDRLAEHPPLRFVVFATVLSCAIPVVVFIVFGITSIIITFAGFLFIEGTLLAVGGFCLFICVATMILLLSILGMTLGVFYILTSKLLYFLSRFESTSQIFKTLAPSIVEKQVTEMSDMIANTRQD